MLFIRSYVNLLQFYYFENASQSILLKFKFISNNIFFDWLFYIFTKFLVQISTIINLVY